VLGQATAAPPRVPSLFSLKLLRLFIACSSDVDLRREAAMADLKVRCPKCERLTSAQMDLSESLVQSMKPEDTNTANCSHCGHIFSWSKKDVDPSNFDRR
jgi:phage FluMu protein Com